MPEQPTKPDANSTTQPQKADGYAAAIDEFLGQLNASTSRTVDRKLTRADFLQCLLNTFSTTDGKVILAWLHSTAGTRKPAFTFGGSADGIAIALAGSGRDGRRGLVWEIEANLDDARAGNSTDKPAANSKRRSRRKKP